MYFFCTIWLTLPCLDQMMRLQQQMRQLFWLTLLFVTKETEQFLYDHRASLPQNVILLQCHVFLFVFFEICNVMYLLPAFHDKKQLKLCTSSLIVADLQSFCIVVLWELLTHSLLKIHFCGSVYPNYTNCPKECTWIVSHVKWQEMLMRMDTKSIPTRANQTRFVGFSPFWLGLVWVFSDYKTRVWDG